MVIYSYTTTLEEKRQLLKALGDDTRLRIVSLLQKERLNVRELCAVLYGQQSSISKHLAKLRSVGIVGDRREGQFVFYYLSDPRGKFHQSLLESVLSGVRESPAAQHDTSRLQDVLKQRR